MLSNQKPVPQNNADAILAGPFGNYTAFVSDFTAEGRKELDQKLRLGDPRIEQTCFIEKTPVGWHGQMAGGEFCGAAALSFGYLLCNWNNSNTATFSFSGTPDKIIVLRENNTVSATLFRNVTTKIEFLNDSAVCLRLPGITHLVVDKVPSGQSPDKYLTNLIENYCLKNEAAVGLMVKSRSQNKIKIDPWVWVREIDSMINETTCISGAAATGLVEFMTQEKLIDFKTEICQPNGEFTRLNYTINSDQSLNIHVQTEINIID
jgi:hypothetical protein